MIEGHIEFEDDFFVLVKIPEKLTNTHLKSLRALDIKLADMPIMDAKRTLEHVIEWCIGPFWPPDKANDVKERLAKVGLISYVKATSA
ncbi:hypothetical protein BTA51_29765 [Hahella sp. CCB-MM4]|nr:hypothetical protein BTA51_29765 [Hahella sp. CCB-MM4]